MDDLLEQVNHNASSQGIEAAMEKDPDKIAQESVEFCEHGGLMYGNPGISAIPVQGARQYCSNGTVPSFATALYAEGLLGLSDHPAGLPKGETALSMLEQCIHRLEGHLRKHPMDQLKDEALKHLYKARERLLAAEIRDNNARVVKPESGFN